MFTNETIIYDDWVMVESNSHFLPAFYKLLYTLPSYRGLCNSGAENDYLTHICFPPESIFRVSPYLAKSRPVSPRLATHRQVSPSLPQTRQIPPSLARSSLATPREPFPPDPALLAAFPA